MDSQSAESTTAIPSAPWALVVTRDIQLRRFLASYLSITGFNAEEIDDVRMAIAMNLNPAVTHSLPADFAAPKTADVG